MPVFFGRVSTDDDNLDYSRESCLKGGVSSVVGFPLSALWVAGSNPVVGRSFQSSLEVLSLHIRIRNGVTGYFSEG